MRVFKFGGASVRDAEGIRNIGRIIGQTDDTLMVVVSAMGKTTNALEGLTRALCGYDLTGFDELYDQVVSTGELQSTRIVSAYLNHCGIANEWVDITRLMVTDYTYRQANVDTDLTRRQLNAYLKTHPSRVYVTQGFIAGTPDGRRTTLGREGSDYTAALLANLLNAESVTLWKDVPGVMSADPLQDSNAHLLPQLTYDETEQILKGGAQIIHPKTIAPLREKNIPLYVKPFLHPEAEGTVIKD
ncbi:MAG: hypothetical protein IJ621_04435 [Paludibacteraceae bacterium]|nr:hypothetical protein [Paludibacteraceae bacterium]